MPLIELSDYTIAPTASGQGLNSIYFSLAAGDVCAVEGQSPNDAYLFVRALATLVHPDKGIYRYDGQKVDLKNQQELLSCKRKIGYIAPDAALISNLNIRQNLLLMQYYFKNDLTLDLDDRGRQLCQNIGLENKLHLRPAALNPREVQAAIIVREYIKEPEVLLLINPEEFIGHEKIDLMTQLFNDWTHKAKPVVFSSHDKRLIRRYAKKKVIIANGTLTTVEMKRFEDTE